MKTKDYINIPIDTFICIPLTIALLLCELIQLLQPLPIPLSITSCTINFRKNTYLRYPDARHAESIFCHLTKKKSKIFGNRSEVKPPRKKKLDTLEHFLSEKNGKNVKNYISKARRFWVT